MKDESKEKGGGEAEGKGAVSVALDNNGVRQMPSPASSNCCGGHGNHAHDVVKDAP